jgi:signal transduction histidine kinase
LERVRTRIAADLHDDIGASLTRISILSEVAHSQLLRQENGLDTPLSSIASIARECVASMSDIVWAINPKKDSLRNLLSRMRRFADEVLTMRGIEFQFCAPDIEHDDRLGADLRRDMFLIFKEALNNAVRHADCQHIEIDFEIERSCFKLKVCDDGKGFDKTGIAEGQGLTNMHRRAKALNGDIQILSAPRQGTEIALVVPRR